ncbi:MAG TPA: hypothetical protein VMU73_00970 [Gaiellaceae bacterium]|nr:hypothetical protein [Gaiellaceae bacterium]
MSRVRIRYHVGTARLRTTEALRCLRGRLRLTPPCARDVPRPRLAARGAPKLELTHALLAVDLHPGYAGLWPVAKRAWSEIAEVEPILVLLADDADVPAELAADPAVRVFRPEPGLDTALQAQCIRLLYPALLDAPGGVITSDVDMVPMSPRYFHRPLRRIDRTHFVCYRDVLLPVGEMPICYNAALPETWSSVFAVDDLDDVRAALRAWGGGVEYEGTRGGAGWTTDQHQLCRILLERGRREKDVWILDDAYTGYRRLERAYVEKWKSLSDDARRGIAHRKFSDFHLLAADSPYASLNELIVDAAIAAAAT